MKNSNKKLVTEKDYTKGTMIINWDVLAVGKTCNIVMSGNFVSREDAEDFRDNAYCGYYRNCIVKSRLNTFKKAT